MPSFATGKWFRGREMTTGTPDLSIWWILAEPPRPASSRNTPIRYLLRSAGSPARLNCRMYSGVTVTSTCAPASNGGSSTPSRETISNRSILPSAELVRRPLIFATITGEGPTSLRPGARLSVSPAARRRLYSSGLRNALYAAIPASRSTGLGAGNGGGAIGAG